MSISPGETDSAKMISLRVADLILEKMGPRRWNRAELARRLGKNPMWVSDRLNGKVIIDVGDLELLAKVLECRIVDLLPADEAERTTKLYGAPLRTAIDQPGDRRAITRPADGRPPVSSASTGPRRPARRPALLPSVAMTLTGAR